MTGQILNIWGALLPTDTLIRPAQGVPAVMQALAACGHVGGRAAGFLDRGATSGWEPARTQLEQAREAAQQRQLQLVVVRQVHQDGPQARLQCRNIACTPSAPAPIDGPDMMPRMPLQVATRKMITFQRSRFITLSTSQGADLHRQALWLAGGTLKRQQNEGAPAAASWASSGAR